MNPTAPEDLSNGVAQATTETSSTTPIAAASSTTEAGGGMFPTPGVAAAEKSASGMGLDVNGQVITDANLAEASAAPGATKSTDLGSTTTWDAKKDERTQQMANMASEQKKPGIFGRIFGRAKSPIEVETTTQPVAWTGAEAQAAAPVAPTAVVAEAPSSPSPVIETPAAAEAPATVAPTTTEWTQGVKPPESPIATGNSVPGGLAEAAPLDTTTGALEEVKAEREATEPEVASELNDPDKVTPIEEAMGPKLPPLAIEKLEGKAETVEEPAAVIDSSAVVETPAEIPMTPTAEPLQPAPAEVTTARAFGIGQAAATAEVAGQQIVDAATEPDAPEQPAAAAVTTPYAPPPITAPAAAPTFDIQKAADDVAEPAWTPPAEPAPLNATATADVDSSIQAGLAAEPAPLNPTATSAINEALNRGFTAASPTSPSETVNTESSAAVDAASSIVSEAQQPAANPEAVSAVDAASSIVSEAQQPPADSEAASAVSAASSIVSEAQQPTVASPEPVLAGVGATSGTEDPNANTGGSTPPTLGV